MTQLINILRFTNLVVGAATPLPHNLNVRDGLSVIPDILIPSVPGFLITADETDVTVTRKTGDSPQAVDVLAWYWNTPDRAFGQYNPAPGNPPDGSLPPNPFVLDPDGAAGGTAWALDVTAVQTADYNASVNELVQCDPSAGGFDVNLPAITGANSGLIIVVKNVTASVNPIDIIPDGADTVDGLSGTNIVSSFGSLMLASDGSGNWNII